MILNKIMLRKWGRRRHDRLIEKVRAALLDEVQRNALLAATRHIRLKSLDSYRSHPASQQILDDVKRSKRQFLPNLSKNVERFISNAESNGVRVFLAKTKEDATDYVVRVLSRAHAKLVVKSKSMTGEELDLNEYLSQAGFTVIETDLGERIVQMAGQRPSHIVAPAIHLTRGQVADIFSNNLNLKVPAVLEEITKLARRVLRENFLSADAGISGANAAIAEDGSVLIVTNEGNERLVTSLPRVYIAIVGIEKIVPTLKDALKVTKALCMSATGQRITSYVSIIKGPNDRSGIDGDKREMHIVLVDNQRSIIAEDEIFREALYCLKCGSCLNVCPTYRQVGGHVFGKNYTGPVGIPWTSFTDSFEAAGEFAPLCISCGLCRLACPVDINLPLLIAHVKEFNAKSDGQLLVNWLLSHYDSFVRLTSLTAPIANRLLRNSNFRWFLEKTVGIDKRRFFPKFERETFEDWYNRQRHPKGAELVYFVDTYANFNNPSVGVAATKILWKGGYSVVVPPQKGSGMPAFLYGELKFLKEVAEFNVESLLPYAQRGIPIVASEPTAAFCLREIYPELLRTEESRIVAGNSYELLGFLRDHWDSLDLKTTGGKAGGKVAYHTPCHTRPMYHEPPGPDLLRRIGLDVEPLDFQGCCGIAGTYGFKKGLDGFDVSMAVGEELFAKIREMNPAYVATDSSVCKLQIEQGLGLTVKHPLEVLAENYGLT